MLDVEPLIAQELDRLAPAEHSSADWADVLARAGAATVRRRRRWPIALAAAAVLMATAIPAVALSAGLRSLLGFPITHPVLAEARLLVSAPIGNGFYAHSWESPSSTGGRCAFTTADHNPSPAHPAREGGGGCSVRRNARLDQASPRLPLVVGLGITRRLKSGDPSRWVPPTVSGSVLPRLRVARLAVTWRGGRRPLILRGTHFLGGGAYLYLPPFGRFPFFVIAYDAQGRVVARKRLQSPLLRLMSRGWKQYAREYRAWRLTHRR